MEEPRVERGKAAAGVALAVSPGLDDVLRWFGALGDLGAAGKAIFGMSPVFVFYVAQWLAATAGVMLLAMAFSQPIAFTFNGWRARHRKRRRFREIFPWIGGEAFRTLERFSQGPLAVKDRFPQPLPEFLVHVTSLGGSHGEVWKLDPTLARLARRLIAKRKATKSAAPPPPTAP